MLIALRNGLTAEISPPPRLTDSLYKNAAEKLGIYKKPREYKLELSGLDDNYHPFRVSMTGANLVALANCLTEVIEQALAELNEESKLAEQRT